MKATKILSTRVQLRQSLLGHNKAVKSSQYGMKATDGQRQWASLGAMKVGLDRSQWRRQKFLIRTEGTPHRLQWRWQKFQVCNEGD